MQQPLLMAIVSMILPKLAAKLQLLLTLASSGLIEILLGHVKFLRDFENGDDCGGRR